MNQLWQMWSGVLDDSTVNNIITESEYYEPQPAVVGDTSSTLDEEYRRSEIRWIDRTDANSKFIADIFWYYAQEANRTAFGFDISMVRDIQYTIYTAENLGKYDWHHDTFWANNSCYDRKISVIIQLTDPLEYTGGDFEIDRQYQQPDNTLLRKKGTVLVIPSFLPHRVTEVTAGVRRSIIAWIEGPKFR